MKVGFYAGWNDKRRGIAESFARGVRRHGDSIELREIGTEAEAGDDVAVLIGNKVQLRVPAGVPIIHLDKSYPTNELRRNHDYARLSINATHATEYLGRLGCPDDRRRLFGWEPVPWRRGGDHVLVFGGSKSFYQRRGIENVQAHLQGLVDRVHRHSMLPVRFRPKPNTDRHLEPMQGAEAVCPYSFLRPLLEGCRTIVVEESAASVEALLCGVPAVVLDDAPTRNISSRQLSEVDLPRLADRHLVENLLSDLAYFQYTMLEFEDGLCWNFVRGLLCGSS
jgi:hypothetical protein